MAWMRAREGEGDRRTGALHMRSTDHAASRTPPHQQAAALGDSNFLDDLEGLGEDSDDELGEEQQQQEEGGEGDGASALGGGGVKHEGEEGGDGKRKKEEGDEVRARSADGMELVGCMLLTERTPARMHACMHASGAGAHAEAREGGHAGGGGDAQPDEALPGTRGGL